MDMSMNKIIHFDIPAEDLDRAQKFYEKTFGWDIKSWEGSMDYRLVFTGKEKQPSVGGGIGKKSEPDEQIRITIGVDSVDEFIEGIENNGGKITSPKSTVPGEGYLATCEDTEGNAFYIMEEDEEAQ